ncbi:hypothetical protein RND71_018296 [Anisodus tanguticus]|uniref:Uncharacterized protein n=1 Tax=Anisodus tanguticus TaxID=243964 RepID=A0AAE1VK29_9SOLA|nr:hypothetical protein RND71_018296 [Anisodus tanguticus]
MTTMASAISAPTSSSLASFTNRRISLTSSISVSKNPKVQFLKCLGLTPFSWNALKQLSISKSHYSVQIGRSRKLKGKGVYASLFGVGAPEALVIGVVALLVFGPKGLAEEVMSSSRGNNLLQKCEVLCSIIPFGTVIATGEAICQRLLGWGGISVDAKRTNVSSQKIRKMYYLSQERILKACFSCNLGHDAVVIFVTQLDVMEFIVLKFEDSEVVNFKSFTWVEVARNLGKTLREFQPTIRELQDVSREFKSTLEREIGLDDIKGSSRDTRSPSTMSPSSDTSSTNSTQVVDPNGSPSPKVASTSEDDLERLMRIAEAEKQAEKDLTSLLESQSESQTVPQDNSSSSDRAYSTEEYLKITEEQLKAAAQKQNETSTAEQSPYNAQSPCQELPKSSLFLFRLVVFFIHRELTGSVSEIADSASSAVGAYSTEELSKNTEMTSPQQSPSNAQSQSQEAPEEAASMIPSSTKPESET